MQIVSVWNATRGECIGHRIEVADTPLRRAWGLLGRKRLEGEQGLWIRPSSGIHTFGMAFAIDVIGLDKKLRVVKLWSDVRPQRIAVPGWRVRSVIELPQGRIAETDVQMGDMLRLQE